MNKWGVRLIGLFFIVWAMQLAIRLITGNHPPHGFLFLVVDIDGIDLAAWIGVCVLVCIGYRLLALDPRSRFWALIMLWFLSIGYGWYFLKTIISVFSHSSLDPITLNFWPSQWNSPKLESTEIQLGVTLATFLYFAIPLYYLLRKDVKQLFQRPVTKVENNPDPEAAIP